MNLPLYNSQARRIFNAEPAYYLYIIIRSVQQMSNKMYDFNILIEKSVRKSGGSDPAAARYVVSFASGTPTSIISRTPRRKP